MICLTHIPHIGSDIAACLLYHLRTVTYTENSVLSKMSQVFVRLLKKTMCYKNNRIDTICILLKVHLERSVIFLNTLEVYEWNMHYLNKYVFVGYLLFCVTAFEWYENLAYIYGYHWSGQDNIKAFSSLL